MAKKTFSMKELEKFSAEEVIEKIKTENYSLLDSFGAEKLRKEMVPIGKACTMIVNYLFKDSRRGDNAGQDEAARKRLVKTFKKIAPGSYTKMPKDTKNGLVVGFNHPSLGEILRILLMKVDVMGDSPMYFPVNLPWYEALAPNYDRIKKIGIIITPTITPSTWRKMKLKEGTKLYELGQKYKKGFKDIYTDLSHEAMKTGGVIFVAPSATRQATVFKSEEAYEGREEIIPTMSMLAVKLLSDPEIKCDFLPLAVLPPENFKRGLNLRKKYRLTPGKVMTAAEIRKKYFKKPDAKRLDGFDYDFHKRIAEQLPRDFWY